MDSRSDVVGAVGLATVVILIGVPVAVGQWGGGTTTVGPWWVWWACYAVFVVAAVATGWLSETRGPGAHSWGGVATMVVTGVALYLLGNHGWTAILLVITAAVAAQVLPRPAVIAVIVLQTAVVPLPGLSREPLWASVLGAAIYGGLQTLSVAAVWIQLRETRMRQELAIANTRLRATTALLAESSRATERLRISRELHDVVGHQLTALALELEVASHHAAPPGRDHVIRARALAKDLLSDVRTAVGDLRDRQPPLRGALELMVADLPSPTVHLTTPGDLHLDEERAAAVIRTVQEVVTNTIRHSGAEQLWVELTSDAHTLVLRAHDDGRGCPDYSPGHGLTGMRERLEEIGGSVDVDPVAGFAIEARVPLS